MTYWSDREPNEYTPDRIEVESRWMSCTHSDGFYSGFLSAWGSPKIEVCRRCRMPRPIGEQQPNTYTFVEARFERTLKDEIVGDYTLVTIPLEPPRVRAL